MCEDGGFGSETFIDDPLYLGVGQTTKCALGTDATDCAAYGPRTSQEITSEASQGVTNFTRPAPPPPQPQEPPPPPPPPFSFDGNLDTCISYFYPNPNTPNAWLFDCSGSVDEIANKRALGKCPPTAVANGVAKCSDGGFGAIAIEWSGASQGNDASATQFACNYGTSTSYCSPRTQDETTDTHCTRNGDDPDGGCRDSCWVDITGGVHHTEQEYDPITVENGGTVQVDTRCHDGGPLSVSNRCPYGTQSTRAASKTISYGSIYAVPVATARRLSGPTTSNFRPPPPPPREVGAPLAPPPAPPPSPSPSRPRRRRHRRAPAAAAPGL